MKKLLFRSVAFVLMAVAALGNAMAQDMSQLPPLPQDPAVRTGKLDNGLTYYIRHNETPKGQADFYIAQQVGSALEEENQRGLAHFLEHMCFNGTENFPEKGIINYLEQNGVKFGNNLNAYTSIDETVYNISNVPVNRTGIQDSCLLILHDWSCALTLDPAEIDAERGVIHEEWRQSNKGSMRIIEELLPVVYPTEEHYGKRLPIGTMEVVDNFPPEALVSYYHKWYRPDNQAIIVVGDIDVDYIEGKIKEIFSPIPMPENPAERVFFPVEDTEGTIYAIGKDKEMEVAAAMIFFKTDQLRLPKEYRNTQAFFTVDYMTTIATMMLQSRLDELGNKPDTKFASAKVEIGDYFVSKTKGALCLDVYAKGGNLEEAIADAYRELVRAARTGFTVGEYERARAEFLSRLEKQYEERDHRESGSYSREYVRLYLDNIPAPGIEVEKQLYEQMAQMISVDMINQLLPSVVIDDNRVVMAMLPDKEGFIIPTEESLAETLENVEDEDLEAYKDEMREDPLIPSLPAPGTIVATKALPQWNATEYTLSNGVKVVVKVTDFKKNEIVFDAVAKGGISTLDPSLAPTIKFSNYAMNAHGLNDYSDSDLKKYMQGKQANVNVSADAYARGIEGSTTVKDLPTLMELIYAYFTGFTISEDEFEGTRGAISGMLSNQESTPNFLFSKYLMSELFSAPAAQILTSADIAAADRQATIDLIRGIMANAADYTFYFVGDIDMTTFEPLMLQYLATLPGNPATATTVWTVNPGFEFPLGENTRTYTTEMETPQSFVFIGFTGDMPYTGKNKYITSVASQALSNRLLAKVREEMGATYSIGAAGMMDRQRDHNTFFQIAFPMKPEMKDETLTIIRGIIEDMAQNVTPDEIKPALEYQLKNLKEDQKKNSSWASVMAAVSYNGVDTFNDAEEVINSITTDDVKAFMQQLLDQHNYITVVLDPTEMPAAE